MGRNKNKKKECQLKRKEEVMPIKAPRFSRTCALSATLWVPTVPDQSSKVLLEDQSLLLMASLTRVLSLVRVANGLKRPSINISNLQLTMHQVTPWPSPVSLTLRIE